jgi:ABC-type branched-subunit amino acid transport system substrate-binding protein
MSDKPLTKHQLEYNKEAIKREMRPLLDEAELMLKSVVADLTEAAELKLAKKIKADVVIANLDKAKQELEIAQRKAKTFFGKVSSNKTMQDRTSYKFSQNSRRKTAYSDDIFNITAEDCREQLRSWAEALAQKEAEKTKAGKRLKRLKLYMQSATDTLYSVGINSHLKETMSKILRPIGIVWDKTEALQIENKRGNLQ